MQVAGYEVLEQIGRGGMGVVYRAEQVALGRQVALKVIAPELAGDEDFRARFKREYRTAASIDHPNVVPIYEAGESGSQLFIAMRLVPGDDLRDILRTHGGLDPSRAADLVAQVGGALDAAHAAGLVHRDVKPANVLVARVGGSEHAFLSDFGLTKHVTSHGGLTRTGQWVGTVDYMAPELVDGRPADARSDVYSLGCVLFEALTGQVPFPRDADMAKLYAHVQAAPPSPSSLRPGLPPALDDLVARALAKDPDQRPQSAGDLGRQARAAVAGGSAPSLQGSVAAGAAAPRSATQTRPRPDPPTQALPDSTPPQWTPPYPPAPITWPQPEPRRGSGMAVAIVIAAAIVALGAVAAVLIATGTLGGDGSSKSASTGAKSTPVAGGTTTDSGSGGATSTTDNTPSAAFEPFEAQTYSAEQPSGWDLVRDDEPEKQRYVSRWEKGGQALVIDTTPNDSSGDPLASVNTVEQGIRGDYRRIAIRPTTIGGDDAAEWEFILDGRRSLDIFFYRGGNGYAVLGSSPPGQFGDMPAITRRVAESIQPR
jgi:serine/threonine-protein kinase